MEVTQKTKAIILRREPFNENDSRVFVYTENFGKLNLVARGTQKLSSKLASHIEPLNLCEAMIVKGKNYDYLGSIISENIFIEIKNNYRKVEAAGETVKIFNEIIKENEADKNIFELLKKFLTVLNDKEVKDYFVFKILKSTFILKLIFLLGYNPLLADEKEKKIKAPHKIIELMKMVLNMEFYEIAELNLDQKLADEYEGIILKYKLNIFD